MTVQLKSMCRMGAGVGLAMGLGLVPDAGAQQPASSFQNRLDNIWNWIVRDDEYQQPPRSSRLPGGLCAIAPAIPGAPIENQTIWHNQPVIAFKPDTIGKISLLTEPEEDNPWFHIPSNGETSVVYDGPPLVSGQTYTLQFHKFENSAPAMFAEFQVLPAATRTLIRYDLIVATAGNDPALEQISDIEKRAIRRASYFANQGLPYDAIQSLFSVDSPSAELSARQAQILEESCSAESEALSE